MSTHEPVVTQNILDLISSKSDEQRAAREMSKEVVDALKACGFFTMLLPKQWGGLERKPQEFFAEQVRIAEADMSTAVVPTTRWAHVRKCVRADSCFRDAGVGVLGPVIAPGRYWAV